MTSVLLTDLYQLTMLQAYWHEGMEETAAFELFVRTFPPNRNFLIAAGLEQTLEYLEHLAFTDEECEFLAQSGLFDPKFIDQLKSFRFTGDVDAMPEGTVFFPNEPILRVVAPLPQAQLVETRLINLLQFQTLIASKAARCVLAAPGALKPSYMVDVSFHYLASAAKPLKNRTRVRFHTGTSEILGNLILLEADEVAPGEATVAQLRLDAPVAVVKGDHYVVRSYSPVRTIGGGTVLHPIPPKHKRLQAEVVSFLKAVADCPSEELLLRHIAQAGFAGISFAELRLVSALTDKTLESHLQGLLSRRAIILVDREQRTFVHEERFRELVGIVTGALTRYHRENPLKSGMPKEELKSRFPRSADPRLFPLVLQQMVREGALLQEEKTVRLKTHEIALASDQESLRGEILRLYRESGLQPPFFRDIVQSLKADPRQAKDVLNLLIEEGKIVRTKEDLFFDAEAIEALRQRMLAFFAHTPEMTPAQFKELTGGAPRKFLIPLLEYFDGKNFTLRVGDVRKLRRA